jgi:hypothetical protein
MKQPLYKIANEYMQAYHNLYSDEAMPEEAIRDTLSGIQGEIEAKALNIAALIKNMEADAKAMKEAESAINERRKRLENRLENLENYLLINLQTANINKPIESPEHYIAIRQNSASVLIEASAKIPDEYMRTKPEQKEPDKTLLKEAINKGKAIEGVSLVHTIKLLIK